MIVVICPIHGEFEIRPADHKRGKECKKCTKQITLINITKHAQKNLQKNPFKFGGGNTIILKQNMQIRIIAKVIIICNTHGEFEQLKPNHYKNGCSSCVGAKIKSAVKERCKNEFEMKSNKIHNNIYDYTKQN